MAIIGWTYYGDPEKEELFPDGMYVSWEDIIEVEDEIARELRRKGYKFCGYYHQRGEYGCPVFDNGKWYGVSFRRWGAIMAKAYPEEVGDPDGSAYTVWAWISPGEQSLPDPKDYEKKESGPWVDAMAWIREEYRKMSLKEKFLYHLYGIPDRLHLLLWKLTSPFTKKPIGWFEEIPEDEWERTQAHDDGHDEEQGDC